MFNLFSDRKKTKTEDFKCPLGREEREAKMTPRKIVCVSKKKKEPKIEDNYILLSTKTTIEAKKKILQQQCLDYKLLEPLYSERPNLRDKKNKKIDISSSSSGSNSQKIVQDLSIIPGRESPSSKNDSEKDGQGSQNSVMSMIDPHCEIKFGREKVFLNGANITKKECLGADDGMDVIPQDRKTSAQKNIIKNLALLSNQVNHVTLTETDHYAQSKAKKKYKDSKNVNTRHKQSKSKTGKRKTGELSKSVDEATKVPNKKKKLPR